MAEGRPRSWPFVAGSVSWGGCEGPSGAGSVFGAGGNDRFVRDTLPGGFWAAQSLHSHAAKCLFGCKRSRSIAVHESLCAQTPGKPCCQAPLCPKTRRKPCCQAPLCAQTTWKPRCPQGIGLTNRPWQLFRSVFDLFWRFGPARTACPRKKRGRAGSGVYYRKRAAVAVAVLYCARLSACNSQGASVQSSSSVISRRTQRGGVPHGPYATN